METAQEVRRKIKTAEDLQSVVRTMKALAAVSIRQYEKAARSLAEYNRTVELGLAALFRNRPEALGLVRQAAPRRLAAVVFGSDQGMCGQLNDLVVAHALADLGRSEIPEEERLVLAVGQRAAARLEDAGRPVARGLSVPGSIAGVTPAVQDLLMLIEEWRAGRSADRVVLYYSERLSGASYRPTTLRLLPADRGWLAGLKEEKWPTRALPLHTQKWGGLFSDLIRQHLFVSLYRAFVESLASENASRLAAMQGAEKNIGERLEELRALYHQRRQMTITEELLDIVAGFSALTEKGK